MKNKERVAESLLRACGGSQPEKVLRLYPARMTQQEEEETAFSVHNVMRFAAKD
jgi:hypothetical protein